MKPTRFAQYVRPLLRLLSQPDSASQCDDDQWNMAIRTARRSGVLAVLHHRLSEAGVLHRVPVRVRSHLESGAAMARHRAQSMHAELMAPDRALAPLGTPVLLLKGAAYAAQALPFARGRIPGDIDLLVPRTSLGQAEALLRQAGWDSEARDPHDERYYREWSHEVPPMRRGVRAMEVDLHHALLPPGGRWQIDMPNCFERSRPVEVDGARVTWRVLAPEDQVLHAAIHLLQDTEHADRLRDLCDIDALLRAHDAAQFWDALIERTCRQGLERPLWYVLTCASDCLLTPLPAVVRTAIAGWAPPSLIAKSMQAALRSALLPPHPDRAIPARRRISCAVLRLRAILQRMPTRFLLRHLAEKLRRRAFARATLAEALR